jgi:hypothetical protein
VIVVAGSSDLMLTEDMLVRLTSLISTTESVGIRSSQMGIPSSPIEGLAQLLCLSLGKQFRTYAPTSQRAGVYNRDIGMVRQASAVFAVFSPDRVMEGGTGHVVKAALDAEVPVEAYTLDEDGTLVLIGSDEGNPNRVHSGSRPDILAEIAMAADLWQMEMAR